MIDEQRSLCAGGQEERVRLDDISEFYTQLGKMTAGRKSSRVPQVDVCVCAWLGSIYLDYVACKLLALYPSLALKDVLGLGLCDSMGPVHSSVHIIIEALFIL